MIACKDEHVGNSWLPYTDEQQKHEQKWTKLVKCERGTVPFTEICFVNKLCQHCKNAPCEKFAPNDVIRRNDGIVMLDMDKAKGNMALVDACPFGMISWNEELDVAQKCTMCAHLLDSGWNEPRCVQACPLRALSIFDCDDEEFEKKVRDMELEPLDEGDNEPRVMYRNLYRFNTCFIAGAVAYLDGDVERAAVDAEIRLFKDGRLVTMAATNFFGEFKIDRLQKNSGKYMLEYMVEGYEPVKREVTINEDSPCLDVVIVG